MFRCLRQRCHLLKTARHQATGRQTLSGIGTRYTASSSQSSQSVGTPKSSSRYGSIEETIRRLLSAQLHVRGGPTSVSSYEEYQDNAGKILDHVLPYEAYPSGDRRAGTRGDEVVLVLHVAEAEHDSDLNHVLSSGFLIETSPPDGDGLERLVVSCAHTLEQLEYRYPGTPKRSYVVHPGSAGTCELVPIQQIISSSPRTDLIIGQLHPTSITDSPRSLPVSPYPMYRGQEVRVHLYDDGHQTSAISHEAQVSPGSWGSWVPGTVLGYRGHGWGEVEPGTSSALPYILVSTLPTPGSSGGPIIDAESGSVVGMISGRRMDNRVEKERGWGSSAESIFELFSIPGFVPASEGRRI